MAEHTHKKYPDPVEKRRVADEEAKAQGTTRAKALQGNAAERDNEGAGGQDLRQEYDRAQIQPGTSGRQDGYNDTQGAGYGQSRNASGKPEQRVEAQQDYDPAHSGVRHAQNRPGTRPPTPGRETGTSWGEDQQMGETTDTPDRKNPAE